MNLFCWDLFCDTPDKIPAVIPLKIISYRLLVRLRS